MLTLSGTPDLTPTGVHIHFLPWVRSANFVCPWTILYGCWFWFVCLAESGFVVLTLLFVPIDLKIGTHIDWTHIIYHAKNCTNQNNVTRISMATKYPIIKHRTFFKTLTILMKLHMEIPVYHYQYVWYKIEHRSKIKVIKTWKPPFELEAVETSGWFQNVTDENIS